jgi:predicted phosphate transport protein (TIGR00153 family)
MAHKQDNYYFSSFIHLVDYSCKAAEFLKNLFANFDPENMEERKNKIHLIEHEADLEKHKVMERLVKEFLPPIDREDVLNILRDIDDVTDAIEDIALRLYMYNVRELKPEVHEFINVVCDCCEALKALMEEFPNFRKSGNMAKLTQNVLRFEEKCDVLYTKAVRDLFVNEKNPILITIWEDLFHRLEQCCDACGQVSSSVETAYMKNL